VSLAHHQIWADYLYHGNHGKVRAKVSDTDILVVFEDDAVITVKNVTKALENEFSNMNTDLLFLGWCYGHKRMPMVRIMWSLLSLVTLTLSYFSVPMLML
jgi:hypothetical protein